MPFVRVSKAGKVSRVSKGKTQKIRMILLILFPTPDTFKLMLKVAAILIVVTILGLVFFDVGYITSKLIKPNIPFLNHTQTINNPTSVSGKIQINGPILDNSTISIGVRDRGSSGSYRVFAFGMKPADDMPWLFTEAKENTTYEFVAYLDENNQVAFSSDPTFITAPATDEVLTLNIETPQASPTPATISGTVYINGYIPQGATFDVMGRVYGSTGNFSEIVDNLPAQVKQAINYSNAQAGTKYEIKGQLFDKNGAVIGASQSVVLSAPSDAAQLTINSSAQPPQGSVTLIQNNTASPTTSSASTSGSTISGTINFNGSAPSGSSIVILAKQPSDASYQVVVNGIVPQNGSIWTWNEATPGITYNMVAVLKGQINGSQNIDYADSQTYTVAAPAQNQLFTLNTGISMGVPTGSVSITCGTKTNNIWNANTVNFSSVTGAQYYSMQIGSTSGGYDISNIAQPAQSTTNQTITVNNLSDSVTYYAQYAVASVTNPTPAQYSPYTSAYILKCPN
jgi:hypothetical protein